MYIHILDVIMNMGTQFGPVSSAAHVKHKDGCVCLFTLKNGAAKVIYVKTMLLLVRSGACRYVCVGSIFSAG